MPSLYYIDDCREEGQQTLKALARKFGNDIVEGTDKPFEALARWQSTLFSHDDLPKVIVIDVQACGGQGMEVLRKLKAHPKTAGIKALVHTESENVGEIAASYVYGADKLVLKFPFNPEANTPLFETCEKWLTPTMYPINEAECH